MSPTNIAIAGSGGIARSHIEAHRALPELSRVVAIVSSDRGRGHALAALVPGARVVDRVDEVVADPSIDAVDICGHTTAHAPTAIAALDAGKHVLIEKPPALTVAAFDPIIDAAQRADRVAMIGQTVRFQPVISRILESVAAGTVGTVGMVRINWYVAHAWPRGWRGWQLDPQRSGGHLIHNGMHSIDLALALLDDEPDTIFVRGWKTYSPDLPTHDSFHIVLRSRAGRIAQLETSYALQAPADPFRRIVVSGTNGTLSHSTATERELYHPTVNGAQPSTDHAMTAEVRAWLMAVRGEAGVPIPLGHSRSVLAAAIAGQRSLETGAAVAIGDVLGEVTHDD